MKVLIAAGGTGGHIYPGLAIAEKIKTENPGAEIIFIGSLVGMEKNIIPQYGYPIEISGSEALSEKLRWKPWQRLKVFLTDSAMQKK